jgi:hypothetical protein
VVSTVTLEVYPRHRLIVQLDTSVLKDLTKLLLKSAQLVTTAPLVLPSQQSALKELTILMK